MQKSKAFFALHNNRWMDFSIDFFLFAEFEKNSSSVYACMSSVVAWFVWFRNRPRDIDRSIKCYLDWDKLGDEKKSSKKTLIDRFLKNSFWPMNKSEVCFARTHTFSYSHSSHLPDFLHFSNENQNQIK